MYDLAVIFMQGIYFLISLQWGLWKAKEARVLYSRGIFSRILTASFHTIIAPISMIVDLYK